MMGYADSLSIDRISSVKRILEDWADWMQGGSFGRGYPSKSIGLSSGYVSSTFEDMCDQVDAQRCRIVDSCVDDLPPNQSAAIYHRYLSAVFRMRDYEGSLLSAHEALMSSFIRKGVMC